MNNKYKYKYLKQIDKFHYDKSENSELFDLCLNENLISKSGTVKTKKGKINTRYILTNKAKSLLKNAGIKR